MIDICCDQLKEKVAAENGGTSPERVIGYDRQFGLFVMYNGDPYNPFWLLAPIRFCPFCGKELKVVS